MDVGCLQLLIFDGKFAIIQHTELICLCFKNSQDTKASEVV